MVDSPSYEASMSAVEPNCAWAQTDNTQRLTGATREQNRRKYNEISIYEVVLRNEGHKRGLKVPFTTLTIATLAQDS